MNSYNENNDENNNSFDYQNDNLTSKRNNLETNLNELSNSNIKLNFISEDNENENDKDNDLNKSPLNNNILLFDKDDDDNSINTIEEGNKNEEEKERKLKYLYHKYINSYKKQKYINIIQDIANKNNLLYINSPTSFNIFLLKIRCLLKILKDEYLKLISYKDENNYHLEISKKISKILKDFKLISPIINPDNKYHYEQITEVYCKFLLYLSLILKLKEEYIKSFRYLIIGINSLKIFFIKQEMGSDIKIYSIYCKLLLLVINQLIGDNNYKNALLYCNTLFKVIEISFKYMKLKKVNLKYQTKFLAYTAYNYLYTGLCLEQKEDINYLTCFEAYKEANFFIRKSEENNNKKILNNIRINNENENMHLLLSEVLIEKFRKKFEEEINRNEKKEKEIKYIIKTKEENDMEKDNELKRISSGLNKNIGKYAPLEKKIYKNILTSNIQNSIEKLDNELISVIYKDNKINNKSKRPLSNNVKKNLLHLKVYNILMSNKLSEYVIKNKNLEFNNPIKEKQSIESLQRYLNKYMYSESPSPVTTNYNSKNNNNFKYKKNKIQNTAKAIFRNKLYKNHRNNRSKLFFLKNGNFSVDKNEKTNSKKITMNSFLSHSSRNNILNQNITNYIGYTTNNNPSIFNKKPKSQYTNNISGSMKEINKNTLKKINKNSNVYSFNNYIDNKHINNKGKLKIKNNFKNSNSFLQNDFERRFLDKNLSSRKYFKKFFYLDSLATKELSFQKKMLNLKDNNSKLYFDQYVNEIKNDGIIAREDVYKKYLELNEKAIDAAKKMQEDEFTKEKKNVNFFENPNNIIKVLNRYIFSSKEKKKKKLKIYSESYKNIKRNNEDKLLNLNNGIKELNYIISYKNKKLKHQKNIK